MQIMDTSFWSNGDNFMITPVTYMALHWLKEQDTKLVQSPQKQFQ